MALPSIVLNEYFVIMLFWINIIFGKIYICSIGLVCFCWCICVQFCCRCSLYCFLWRWCVCVSACVRACFFVVISRDRQQHLRAGTARSFVEWLGIRFIYTCCSIVRTAQRIMHRISIGNFLFSVRAAIWMKLFACVIGSCQCQDKHIQIIKWPKHFDPFHILGFTVEIRVQWLILSTLTTSATVSYYKFVLNNWHFKWFLIALWAFTFQHSMEISRLSLLLF